MPGEIDINFIHDCDRLRAHEAGDRAGTEYFKSLTGQITQQAFGHLATCRVAGAKKQHARFLNHGGPSVNNLRATTSPTKWRLLHRLIARPQKAEHLLV